MNEKQKKLIFEYMGWCPKHPYCDGWRKENNCEEDIAMCSKHPLDGNDMVAAMNKIVKKGDWGKFYDYIDIKWTDDKDDTSLIRNDEEVGAVICRWLMQPNRFFDLMGGWLEEKDAKVK